MKLDRYDRAIVRALQLDGRITNSQLAESVSLSESACLRRVRALEESGFIEGYTALINQQKAGCPVNVFVNITLDRQEQAHLHEFEEAARKVPEVMECYLMSGEYDFLLRVVLADTADFELGPKRRWRHSEDYLRNEATRAGLDIAGLLACHPRSEAGIPVEGLAVALSLGVRAFGMR